MATPPISISQIPIAVTTFCEASDLGAIQAIHPLKGGVISHTSRLVTRSGATLVLKQSVAALPDMYPREAEGLQTLQATEHIRTPRVYAVHAQFLLLEDLGTAPAREDYWQAFGHALALQHRHTHPLFGFHHDNYLGLLPQRNPWTADGYEFFAQERILRFLDVPLCVETLTPEDRRGLQRLAQRLPMLIPPQPAALLHGDLWHSNMLVGPAGEPAFIDPAVYYGWPEAELSMVQQYGGPPAAFYAAYCEVNPLQAGWQARLEILYLREWLSVVAHFGSRGDVLSQIRALLAKYA